MPESLLAARRQPSTPTARRRRPGRPGIDWEVVATPATVAAEGVFSMYRCGSEQAPTPAVDGDANRGKRRAPRPPAPSVTSGADAR